MKSKRILATAFVVLISISTIHPATIFARFRQPQRSATAQDSTVFEHKLSPLLRGLRESLTVAKRRARSSQDQGAALRRFSGLTPIEVDDRAEPHISVLAELHGQDTSAIEALGLTSRARVGSIVAITLPLSSLDALAALPSVKSLEPVTYEQIRSAPASQPNDLAIPASKIDRARNALGLNGRGVVVGVIDTGIDIAHPDFRNPDGTTRIRALWDVSDPFGSGPGGVGRVFTAQEINGTLQGAGVVTEADRDGHGTHVCGTAAGNGRATGNNVPAGLYAGGALEADIVFIKGIRREGAGFRTDDQVAALDFIRAQAAALGQPFVINLSLGGHFGSHDGFAANEKAIDALVNEAAGRAVIIAAGNEGSDRVHASGQVRIGNPVTLEVAGSPDFIDLWYSGSDILSVQVVKPDGTVIGPVPFNSSNQMDTEVDVLHFPSSNGNGDREIIVSVDSNAAGVYRILLTGTTIANGRIDAWTNGEFESTADQSMTVGTPGTARGAITVGAYTSKINWTSINNRNFSFTGHSDLGDVTPFSSRGPTRDNRLKPEIAAPGSAIVSSLSADVIVGDPSTSVGDSALVNQDGRHTVQQGTSQATPNVTGAVALMLQRNPNLTAAQIKSIIQANAARDNLTGNTPNNTWGAGKLDALAAANAVAGGGQVDPDKPPAPRPDPPSLPAGSNLSFAFSFDTSNVVGGIRSLIEVSRPGTAFANPNGTAPDPNDYVRLPLALRSGTLSLPAAIFPAGVYQVRAGALHAGGVVIGRFSDSATFTVTGAGGTNRADTNFGFIDATPAAGGAQLSFNRLDGMGRADDDNQPLQLPFAFRFFDQQFLAGSALFVCTNGWASFTNTSLQLENSGLPGVNMPENLLAVFFDDLVNANNAQSGVFSRTVGTAPNRQFVVEWLNSGQFDDGGAITGATLTFELILFEGSNDIKFQYLTLQGGASNGSSATVGIQNDARNEGIQAVFNQGLLGPGGVFVFAFDNGNYQLRSN
ncbi:MAG: S8 family peptidase [Acidobacteria bacterium]|nr:S8 family peptidase [Acidobacteriota bacterium]